MQQVQWSKLSAYNLVIWFRPGKFGTKHDALTRWWVVYLKEGSSDYASVNLQNFHPVFTSEQLASSLWATTLTIPVLWGSLMDAKQLHANIQTQLWEDPISNEHLGIQSDPNWTLDPDGLLHHLGQIYVLNTDSLQLHVLQYSHDHPLAGHFSQMKTLHQVWQHYYWPGLHIYVKD